MNGPLDHVPPLPSHSHKAVRRVSSPRKISRKRSAADKGALGSWWGMVNSRVAVRSQLLLCSPAINSATALRVARLEPRDRSVTDSQEQQARVVNSEIYV